MHPVVNGEVVFSVSRPCECLVRARQEYMRTNPCRIEYGANPEQTFTTFKILPGTKASYDAAKAWASPGAAFIWLLLYGGVGNGKSHLCSAALNALLDRGQMGVLRPASVFVAMLRGALADHTTDAMMAAYQGLSHVIIDDLGAGMKHPDEPGSEWEWARIEELLVIRYERRLPTMLSINFDWTKLPARIASRFQDRELSRMVRNDAADYRGKK